MSGDIDKLKKAFGSLKESFAEIVLKLALLAEYHDDSTGTHLVRVIDYSVTIAKALGLDKSEIEDLRFASCLHDVGKIGVPDHVLKKKGKLTRDEFAVIKNHPLIGARIFEEPRSKFLKMAHQVILYHHEYFDGGGYPHGLKGDAIPIYARIVSLADVFDALTSQRPYRDPIGFDESIEYVKANSGKQFDPHLVFVFLKNIDKIKKIWQANIQIQNFLDEHRQKGGNLAS